MKYRAILLFLMLASGFASAKSAECVMPVFPEASTSDTSVRRVEKQVKAWRSCELKSATAANHEEADKKDAEVNAGLEKWMTATLAQSGAESSSKRAMNRLEADQAKYARDIHRARGK